MSCPRCGGPSFGPSFMDSENGGGRCFNRDCLAVEDDLTGPMKVALVVIAITLLVGLVAGTWAVIELVGWLVNGGAS